MIANMPSFDVNVYLKHFGIAPSRIDPLAGGVVNETYRVGIDQCLPPPLVTPMRPSWCIGQDTVILKYAPPFIARVGPEAPFDVRRQQIEASVSLIAGIGWEHSS